MLIVALFLASSDVPDVFSILEEEQAVITAGRVAQKGSETTLTVEVISGDEVRRSGVELLPEVLRRFAGMDIAQTTMSDYQVSIRGDVTRTASPDKVLLLIDSRPMTYEAYGGVPWNGLSVPLDIIDRIEIVRGPGTAMYGGIGMIGVVNIITIPVAQRAGVYARTMAGGFAQPPKGWIAYGHRGGIATIWGEGNRHELSAAASFYHTLSPVNTIANARAPNVAGHGMYTFRQTAQKRLSVMTYISAAAREIARTTLELARGSDAGGSANLGIEYVVDPENDAALSYQLRSSLIANPQLLPEMHARLDGVREAAALPSALSSLNEALVRIPLPREQKLTVGADARFLFLFGGAIADAGRTALDASVFAVDQARVNAKMLVEAALRTGVRMYPSGGANAALLVSPRLGVAFPLHPEHTLRLSAAYSQRPPSPLELFALERIPTMLQGNPNLVPEGLLSLDLGYQLRKGHVELGITPFFVIYHHLRQRSDGTPQTALNDPAPLPGAGTELTFSYRPTPELRVRANYSFALYWQNGRIEETGAPHKANLVFDATLPLGFALNSAVGYVSSARYLGPLADTFPTSVVSTVPDRFYSDLSLSWRHGSGVGLQLSMQNLNRAGTLLRAEYPGLAAQPPAPRFLLALSYDASNPVAGAGAWHQRSWAQLAWALAVAAVTLPLNIVPLFL